MPDELDRRDFLKHTGALGASVALAGHALAKVNNKM
ncbi:MAG: twin-arginine translocation signal domain-containing protein, partial [Acidobacteriaceae bacterium]|nr:twin-arginine translocation signal domain-containing protein [Acidobacteriaceae bacterium]